MALLDSTRVKGRHYSPLLGYGPLRSADPVLHLPPAPIGDLGHGCQARVHPRLVFQQVNDSPRRAEALESSQRSAFRGIQVNDRIGMSHSFSRMIEEPLNAATKSYCAVALRSLGP